MKKVISILMISLPLICLGQAPEGTAKIKKRIATEFDNGNTLKQLVRYYYYDSLGQELSTNWNSKSMLKEDDARYFVVLDKPEKYIQALISSNGDTINHIIYLFDENGNRRHNFQISSGGDTINSQKRKYDNRGNWLELYNKNNSNYYLFMERKYDHENNVTESMTYNKENKLVRLEKY